MSHTNYIDIYNNNINNIIKLIEKKKISSIIKIRETLYDLISKNYSINEIFNKISKYFISNYNFKKEMIDLSISYEYKINNSFKSIIHLEAFLINILNIIL